MTKIWINGKFFDSDKARVSVFDRGFLYGDGVFETMRCYAGVVFKLDEHLDRLFESLKIAKIKMARTKGYLRDAIYRCLTKNRLKNAYIRLAITRGEGRFGISYEDVFTPNIVIVTKEFAEYPVWMYDKGIRAKVIDKIRQNEVSPISGIKSLNFLNYILARLYTKEDGFDEAILMNTNGDITEASTSNIFLVKRGVLFTPSVKSGIIPGITRGVIMGIARRLRFKVMEKKVSYRELISAEEVFLTNSLVEVLPVVEIDSRRIGDGLPGETTKLLRVSYQKEVIKEVLR